MLGRSGITPPYLLYVVSIQTCIVYFKKGHHAQFRSLTVLYAPVQWVMYTTV